MTKKPECVTNLPKVFESFSWTLRISVEQACAKTKKGWNVEGQALL